MKTEIEFRRSNSTLSFSNYSRAVPFLEPQCLGAWHRVGKGEVYSQHCSELGDLSFLDMQEGIVLSGGRGMAELCVQSLSRQKLV